MSYILKHLDTEALRMLAQWRQGAHYLIANIFKDTLAFATCLR